MFVKDARNNVVAILDNGGEVAAYEYDAWGSCKVVKDTFTLRCLQRLSRPDLATRLCIWQCNRCTRGQSIPVLSY